MRGVRASLTDRTPHPACGHLLPSSAEGRRLATWRAGTFHRFSLGLGLTSFIAVLMFPRNHSDSLLSGIDRVARKHAEEKDQAKAVQAQLDQAIASKDAAKSKELSARFYRLRFAEVSLSGWDTHTANFVKVPELCKTLDRALAALLADLHTRGLLRETLVVLATEFGRTPNINQNAGRDHYPQAFSCLLAGGGIKGGFVYGKTDKEGRKVAADAVKVTDFNATLAYALGLPLDKIVHSPSDRPFTVADKGKPVLGVFA